jgi:hypothetical protein
MMQGIPERPSGDICIELAMAILKAHVLHGRDAFLSEPRALERRTVWMSCVTLQASIGGK